VLEPHIVVRVRSHSGGGDDEGDREYSVRRANGV
jgi:hypothetical protein